MAATTHNNKKQPAANRQTEETGAPGGGVNAKITQYDTRLLNLIKTNAPDIVAALLGEAHRAGSSNRDVMVRWHSLASQISTYSGLPQQVGEGRAMAASASAG